MVKQTWAKRRASLKKSGRSMAELTRATGIPYPRIAGYLNGYWDLNQKEDATVEKLLQEWEKTPLPKETVS